MWIQPCFAKMELTEAEMGKTAVKLLQSSNVFWSLKLSMFLECSVICFLPFFKIKGLYVLIVQYSTSIL